MKVFVKRVSCDLKRVCGDQRQCWGEGKAHKTFRFNGIISTD